MQIFLVKYFLPDISFRTSGLPIRFKEAVLLHKHFVNVFVALLILHKKVSNLNHVEFLV